MPIKPNKKAIHPGEMLLGKFLKPHEISQKELAEHLGWTTTRLSEIIHAKRGITADSALSLADAFGLDPEFWLNLQINWDLAQARKNHVKKALFLGKRRAA
jgi:addiction module HigA family antidote